MTGASALIRAWLSESWLISHAIAPRSRSALMSLTRSPIDRGLVKEMSVGTVAGPVVRFGCSAAGLNRYGSPARAFQCTVYPLPPVTPAVST